MWWGYRHQNGSVQLKRWLGDKRDYTEDCEGNPFVGTIVVPFESGSRQEAIVILNQKLKEAESLDKD
jgi:hypothetical protein